MVSNQKVTLSGIVLFLGITVATACAASAAEQAPNIVFIMADDLGWQELGCYGQKKIQTPHIDQLAGEGMRLTQYYSGSPVYGPARCNLLTGMHGGHAFARDYQEVKNPSPTRFGGQLPLAKGIRTVAEAFKDRG